MQLPRRPAEEQKHKIALFAPGFLGFDNIDDLFVFLLDCFGIRVIGTSQSLEDVKGFFVASFFGEPSWRFW